MNELDLIIDKLPLQVDGHRLQIWREKDNTSWDIAYNTDSGNLKPIIYCTVPIHLVDIRS